MVRALRQWRGNGNMIGGAGARGSEAADYPREASACEGQESGGLAPPPVPPPLHYGKAKYFHRLRSKV